MVSCPASPARQVFAQALCLCGDARLVGAGLVVSGDGGTVGINGVLDVVGTHQVSGDVTAFRGVTGVGALTVGGSLATNERVEGVGEVHVAGDLSAGGGVENVGSLEVKGTLRTPAPGDFTGSSSIGAVGPYTALAAPPCGCGADQVLDVVAAVQRARDTNDDAAAGLEPVLEAVGDYVLTLGSGSYYLQSFSTVGSAVITIDGAVALFVDGDLETVGDAKFDLTPGSTLDLYVAGSVSMVGSALFNHAAPGTVRLYVGGPTGKVDLVGAQEVIGAIYAPDADLCLVGDTRFVGSLFARSLDGVGQLSIDAVGQTVLGPDSDACQPTPVIGLQ
jgi:hypothetical protein